MLEEEVDFSRDRKQKKRWKYLSVVNQRPGPNRLEIL